MNTHYNWYKIAQESQESQESKEEKPIYMIEKGILYDENADEVFSVKELLRYNVPIFKTPQQANEFLSQLEIKTKRQFGRVPEQDLMKQLKYKDTNKERKEEELKYFDDKSKSIQRGKLYDTPNKTTLKLF